MPSKHPFASAASERLQLSLAYFLYFITLGLVLPYFPPYLRARGLDGVAIGWLLAMGPLMKIAVPPLLGAVADGRRGPRFWGVVAAWGTFGGMLLVWASAGHAALFAGAILYSLFSAPSMSLLDATTVRHVRDGRTRFGRIRVWGSVGYILTSFGLGIAFPALPPDVIIWGLVGSQLVFALFFTATRVEDAPASKPVWTDLPHVLRPRVVWLLLLTLFLNRVASSPFNGFYTIFVRDARLGGEVVALTWGIAISTEVFVMLVVDRLIDRFGAGAVLAAGVLLEAARWAAYGFIESQWALLAVAPAHGTAFALLYVGSVRAVTEFVPRQFRALGQGLSAAAAACGQTAGFVAAGYLYKNSGSRVMFTAAGLTGLAATILALLFARAERRRAARTPEAAREPQS